MPATFGVKKKKKGQRLRMGGEEEHSTRRLEVTHKQGRAVRWGVRGRGGRREASLHTLLHVFEFWTMWVYHPLKRTYL